MVLAKRLVQVAGVWGRRHAHVCQYNTRIDRQCRCSSSVNDDSSISRYVDYFPDRIGFSDSIQHHIPP